MDFTNIANFVPSNLAILIAGIYVLGMFLKKKLMEILQALGFVDKAKSNTLTDDDWKQIEASFKEKFGTTIAEEMAASERAAKLEQERKAALNLINEAATTETGADETETDTDDDATDESAETQDASLETAVQSVITKLEETQKQNKTLLEKMETMAQNAAPDKPVNEVARKLHVSGPGMHANKNYLFGIEHKMFSMDSRWNKIAANVNEAKLTDPSRDDFKDFQTAVSQYASSLAARYRYLKENNMLDA